jgi:hypothetical protein
MRRLSQRIGRREDRVSKQHQVLDGAAPSRPCLRFWIVWLALCVCRAVAVPQTSPHGPIKAECEECHTPAAWTVMRSPAQFDHSQTRFALRGQHAAVACRSCHPSVRFANTSKECRDCHSDVHRGELGTTCERCHSPQTWLVPDMPQRHAQTRFPLVGVHLTVACEECHLNQQKHEYVHVPTECFSCHKQQYQATLSPAHVAAGFGTDCVSCHSINSRTWGGSFDHSRTGFPLTGAHLSLPCNRCHLSNRFGAIPAQCVNCHQGEYANSKDPPHAASAFPTDCVSCHTTLAWHPATFDHNRTAFPLTGSHAAVPCVQCHKNGQYKGTPAQCVNCHQGDFNASVNPPHVASAFPTNCVSCHTTLAWKPATFDHNSTPFPLTGGHTTVTCAQCHVNNVYAGLTTDCYTCHTTTFRSATTPVPHTGFPTACTSCHTTNPGWQPSTYSHSGATPRFPQDNRHTTAACAKCHQTATNYTQYCCQSSGCHNSCQGGG